MSIDAAPAASAEEAMSSFDLESSAAGEPPPGHDPDGAIDPALERPQAVLRGLAWALKRAVEQRRWDELAWRIESAEVWAFDRPLPTAEALGHVAAILDGTEDLFLDADRVLKAEIDGDRAHLSLACCLMWGEAGSWREHEYELDLHAGFRRRGETWAIAYLGATPVTPEHVPHPDDDEPA